MLKKCKTCMTMRAKFILWLGKKLGVMDDAKPEPKQEKQMGLTTNDLLIVIGEQTLEIKMLNLQLAAAQKRIAELEPKKETSLEVVK